MKNLKGILLGVLVFGLIVGGIIFWQANEKVADPVDEKSEVTYRMEDLMVLDETAITDMNDRVISISGIVHATEGDDLERTITLGVTDFESIICQIDNRHLAKANKLVVGHFVKIKGTVSGHDFDEMLGKTIQLKNCVLTQ